METQNILNSPVGIRTNSARLLGPVCSFGILGRGVLAVVVVLFFGFSFFSVGAGSSAQGSCTCEWFLSVVVSSPFNCVCF